MADNSERALVTGASGYIGSRLAPALLADGWQVTVLARHPEAIRERSWARDETAVRVVSGDATKPADLARALEGADVAYYLLHSMDGQGDFQERDKRMAHGFAQAAADSGVSRIIYQSGLHPQDEELSDHLSSRAEVGEIFLASEVPATVLQAAVIIGSGSASFEMLRHLTHRLPAMVAPKWLRSRIEPIAIRDVVRLLVATAALPADSNRTFDIGCGEVLTYQDLIGRFATADGLRPRLIVPVPFLSPWLASHWVGLVTPVPTGVAKPLVGSLVHDVVCSERDIWDATGVPTPLSLDASIAAALGGNSRQSGGLPEPGEADPAWLTSADPEWAG